MTVPEFPDEDIGAAIIRMRYRSARPDRLRKGSGLAPPDFRADGRPRRCPGSAECLAHRRRNQASATCMGVARSPRATSVRVAGLQRREAAEREERRIGDALRAPRYRSTRRRRDARHCTGSARRRSSRSCGLLRFVWA